MQYYITIMAKGGQPMANIHEKLRRLRLEKGMTLADVGKKIGVNEATVQRYESGQIRNIKQKTIVKLAELFSVAPLDLMGWEAAAMPYRADAHGRYSLEKVLKEPYLTYNGCVLSTEDREKVRKIIEIVLGDSKEITRRSRAAKQETEADSPAQASVSPRRSPLMRSFEMTGRSRCHDNEKAQQRSRNGAGNPHNPRR